MTPDLPDPDWGVTDPEPGLALLAEIAGLQALPATRPLPACADQLTQLYQEMRDSDSPVTPP